MIGMQFLPVHALLYTNQVTVVVHCQGESKYVGVSIVLVYVLLVGQPHQISLQLHMF